ncbi:MAG: hypothetical protein ACP8RL_01070 [cyanobacterium endosymbiont of Rhopalodia inflata]
MQTSPIATRLNLFGESFIRVRVEHRTVSSAVDQSSHLNVKYLKNVTQKATDYFHRNSQLKQLFSETNQSINVSSTSSSKRLSSLQKRPESFRHKTINSNIKSIKKIGQKLQQWINLSLIEEINNPFQIRKLIFAVIDYLVRKKQSNFPLKPKQSIENIKSNFLSSNFGSHQSKLTNENIDDLWLSWDDLYPGEKTSNSFKKLTDLPIDLPQASKEETNLAKFFKKDLKVHFQGQSQQRRRKKNKKLKPVAISVSNVKTRQNFAGIIPSTNPAFKKTKTKDNLREILPNWIETEAKSTGYVKHPLENILGWLDMIISWIERLVSKLWEALRKLTK